MHGLALGAFELDQLLATGGMGEVWLGRHRRSGRPVAIKLIGGSGAPHSIRLFEQEVRAVAKLEHPGIVGVLDHGRLPGSDAPYLVMERASTTVAERPPDGWPDVRWLLLQVLDGLAHAHARGVLHRDLKPSNILCFDTGAHKLSDFGIAVALTDPSSAGIAGTPAYMAPDLLLGQWRRYGPWTDLYSVGILAWELVTGQRPFEASGFDGYRAAHLHQSPPPLRPRMVVPHDLEAWLLNLLHKDPFQRFQRAADAAAALTALGEAQMEASVGALRPEVQPGSQTMTLDALLRGGVVPVTATTSSREAPPPAPMPERWQQPQPARWDLDDAGLGLYGLRPVPMVDRDPQRELLWRALRAVRAGERHAFLLTGEAGTGKSRLARWLCERGHEVGGAEVLTAVHGAQPGPRDGVLPMLVRQLRADGLGRAVLASHLPRVLPGADSALLLDLLDVLQPLPGQRSSPAARLAALHDATIGVLQHLAARRPVVVWLDDLHASAESVRFAERLLEAAVPGVVLLGTVRDDLASGIEGLLAHEAAVIVPVGRLVGRDRTELVRALLGLDDALVLDVETRTDGNPLFAVQLVADWVQRGILVPGNGGFRLRPGAPTPPPKAVRDVWADRVHDLVERRPTAHRRALWLAAVLGTEVDAEEWSGACARADVDVPEDLPGDLEVRHLARVTRDGWAFAHTMLVETLLLEAGEALPELRGHAGAELCARALNHEDDGQMVAADTLLGRAESLLTGQALVALRAQWGPVKRKLGQPEQALQMLELALAELSGDPAGRAHCSVGIALTDLGRFDDALVHYELARPLVHGDPLDEAQLSLNLGQLFMARGQNHAAIGPLEHAIAIAQGAGNARMQGAALCNLGVLHHDAGRLDQARDCYERSQAILRRAGDPRTEAMICTNLALVAHSQGRLDQVEPLLEQALQMHRSVANRRSEGIALANLGLLAHTQGRLVQAQSRLEAAVQAGLDSRNPRSLASCQMNLGVLIRARGDLEAAVVVLHRAIEAAESVGHPILLGRALGELGETLRRQGDLGGSRAALQRAATLCAEADDSLGTAVYLSALLAVELRLGVAEPDDPRRAIVQAAHEGNAEPTQYATVQCHLCRIAAHGGDPDAAREHLAAATAVLVRMGVDRRSDLGCFIAEAEALLAARAEGSPIVDG